jgi:hypothetical protein
LVPATPYVQAREDHGKGWSWTHAVIADGSSNAAGLAAGTAAEVGIAALAVAAPEGVAAGLVIGGGAVTSHGVGTFAYELTHAGNWSEHIHQDRVVAGIGEGIGAASATWWDEDVIGLKTGPSAPRKACGARYSADKP